MAFAQDDVDFEQWYQGETAMGSTMPWDIGRPQPALVALVDSGQVRGDVLDIGCGLGNNSIFLASRGFAVTGVDGSQTALTEARRRAGDLGIDFQQGEATSLAGLEGRFDTVVDSALYHCLTPAQRHEYVDALVRVTRPGALLHIFCFSTDLPAQFPAPFRITEANLRETVGSKWTITHLGPALYDTNMNGEAFLGMVRALVPESDVPRAAALEVPVDERGNLRLAMWQLTATRAE
ncbi:class I SAM-dependent methyltransferase [Actinocrispum sp. NPDC049592]|uniref:class I SAM-dependent methyltransferase n=1 Tax=Actinocrispum sp. NPDC049592 TaxID=3154835 RepID=UPI003420CE12